MRALVRKTAQLGEVVAAVFDKAGHYSRDPQEVSRLATQAVARIFAAAAPAPGALAQASVVRPGPVIVTGARLLRGRSI